MAEIAKHNWLKDKRFWIFWVIQAVIVTIILVLNLPAVFQVMFINAGWSDIEGYTTILTIGWLSYVLIPQLLTAALYRRDNFWVLIGLVLLSLVYSVGFAIALAMRLVDKSGIIRAKGLVVAIASVIIWWLFMQLMQVIVIVCFNILIKIIPPTIAV